RGPAIAVVGHGDAGNFVHVRIGEVLDAAAGQFANRDASGTARIEDVRHRDRPGHRVVARYVRRLTVRIAQRTQLGPAHPRAFVDGNRPAARVGSNEVTGGVDGDWAGIVGAFHRANWATNLTMLDAISVDRVSGANVKTSAERVRNRSAGQQQLRRVRHQRGVRRTGAATRENYDGSREAVRRGEFHEDTIPRAAVTPQRRTHTIELHI